jgi:hypothetical protein
MIPSADATGERAKRRSEYLLKDADFVEMWVTNVRSGVWPVF